MANRRCELAADEVVVVEGVRITFPIRTAFEPMRTPPLVDAVAAIDALLNVRLLTQEELSAYMAGRSRWRGLPIARRVLALADGGAESPMESRLRLIWVLGGLPRLLVNVPLFDTYTGMPLGRPDLLDDDAGVVIEYDGAHHRHAAQHRADNVREHLLEEAGLIVIRFDGRDTSRTQQRTLEVMRSARCRGLRRDRRRDRWSTSWTPWWE